MSMKKYSNVVSPKATPQNQPVFGKEQVKNSAGGFVFAITPEQQLKRFLILGSEGGSYYASERALTEDNAKNVVNMIRSSGVDVVDMVVQVSTKNLAPKNDPALFVLALAVKYGNTATKKAAFNALPLVARTGTHLFSFVEAANAVRGWGRMMKTGVAKWYTQKEFSQIAYQMVKYRQRNGWSHGDVIRLAHPNPGDNKALSSLFKWATYRGEEKIEVGGIVAAFEEAKTASEKRIIQLIHDHNLPWEAIPTEKLNTVPVQEALLENMPITATMRQLNRYTKSGLVAPLSAATALIVKRFKDESAVKKSRVHPLNVLMAMKTYASGKSFRGTGDNWDPVQKIVAAMDDMFYLAFQNINPAGKRTLLGVDVSGSMSMGGVAGTMLTPREAAAAMAMVTVRTEPQCEIYGFSNKFIRLPINEKMSLVDINKAMCGLPFDSTDCALPMMEAQKNKWTVDTFQIYTDNETWAGRHMHPFQALQAYRQSSGINARLIVAGFTATNFSIADPSDAGMMDVVGMDSSAPALMADFSAGRL